MLLYKSNILSWADAKNILEIPVDVNIPYDKWFLNFRKSMWLFIAEKNFKITLNLVRFI